MSAKTELAGREEPANPAIPSGNIANVENVENVESVAIQPEAPKTPETPETIDRVLYFERDLPFLSRRPYLFWVLVGAFFLALSLGMGIATKNLIFFKCAAVLAVGLLVIPFSVKFGFSILVGWREALLCSLEAQPGTVEEWHRQAIARLRGSRPAEVTGALLVPWSLFSFYRGGYFAGLSYGQVAVLASVIALSSFASGVALYSLLYLARLVWSLGNFAVVVEAHKFGILTVGRGLLRCYVAATGIWMIISLGGSWRFNGAWPPVMFIGPPCLFVIVGSFVFCQLPLHWRMLEFKQMRLFALDRTVAELRPRQAGELTDERLRQLQYFEKERERVCTLPEWPFGWRSFAGLVVSSLVPVVPVVLQLTLKSFLRIP